MMRRMALILVLALSTPAVWASGEALPYHFEPNLDNLASLQRGAKLFMNYCSGCHSLKYVRYKSFAEYLGIPPELVKEHLIFGHARIHDRIGLGLPERSADWFGKAPPDLSLVARARSPSWIYNFLLTFYLDESSTTGVNNLVFDNTAMPFVLAPLQGYQRLVHAGGHGPPEFELVQKGSMTPEEYRQAVADITNFLVFVGEPAKMVRYDLGFKVVLFLIMFALLAWLLKREFWRDVH